MDAQGAETEDKAWQVAMNLPEPQSMGGKAEKGTGLP